MSPRFANPLTFFLDWGLSVMDVWFGPAGITIRRARAGDAAAIAALHAAAFAHPWSAATIEQMLTDRAIDAFVAEAAGGVRGFVLIRRAADEAELLSIAVEAGRRRGGAGRRLIEAGLDALARQRVARLFLEVESGNAPALALYRRLGFAEIGRRRGYYRRPEGARDALTMRLDLAGRPLPSPVPDA